MRQARWRILQDESTLARAAAEEVIAAIESGGERPAICLTGGSSPRRLYALLGEPAFARRIPWRNVHWFVGDERLVPPEHEFSNLGQARRLFLDHHAPAENIHAVPTDAADVHAAADAYAAKLEAFHAGQTDRQEPLFALVLLGVGPDGHVASLFPGQAAARERRRWVVGVEQADLPPLVPRVSLTVPALSSCRELLFIASGRDKAAILARIASGADLPATAVDAASRISWLVDETASPSLDALGARLILVMGVSGSGKTTIGSELARQLGWSFLDADDLHPQANKEKMHAGLPLSDVDRSPWLDGLHGAIEQSRAEGLDLVLACSALKRSHRARILGAHPRHRIVHLRGPQAVIAPRLQARERHFMPPSLLPDQFDALEEPGPEEQALVVDVVASPEQMLARILDALHAFIMVGRI